MRTIALLLLMAASALLWSPCAAADESGESWQVPVTMGADGWLRYENPRFGFIVPVPPGMKALRPPDNGDGQRFASADDQFTLTAWGGFNVDGLGSVEARYKDELAQEKRTVTYKRKTAGWYVVSGVEADGTGFYTRYEANERMGSGFTITYPQAKEARFTAWVEKIAKGWQARLGKGDDH